MSKPAAIKTGSAITDLECTASITVANTGSVTGSEVVQLYISLPATSEVTHPPRILRAFAKTRDVKPGERREVTLKLDKYAVSYWEERIDRWNVESGEYGVYVGPSSEELPLQGKFVIEKEDSFEWNGL